MSNITVTELMKELDKIVDKEKTWVFAEFDMLSTRSLQSITRVTRKSKKYRYIVLGYK